MKWDAALYDQKHDFVSKYGEDLVTLLNPQKKELILDVGCGTGDLAATIKKAGATVIGFDNSTEMIATARKKYPDIQFDVRSAQDFRYDMKFDAVFSNATLHWVLEYENAIKCIYDSLKPKGRLVAEFGGKGNVSNIVTALKLALVNHGYAELAARQVWYFPSLSAYTSLLEATGFRVVFAAHFDRATLLKDDNGIRSWLQMFGKPYLQEVNSEKMETILQDIEEQIKATNYKNNQWYADYVRLRVIAIK